MSGEVSGYDVGEVYRSSVRAWVAALDGINGAWGASTPCVDWDVRALVNHVVGEDRWTRPLVEGLTIAEVGDSLDGDLLGDEPTAAARSAAAEALAAVEARLLAGGGTVHLSYGVESLTEYLWQLTADHLIHAWDLAAATGQDRVLDSGLVDAVGSWFAEREQMYRSGGAIQARPEEVTGVPGDDLLIAFGRSPAWTAERAADS
jgi:uncharacterized protein (TIGR03086 family)